jgi:arylsulfatase A-like enzyme
MSTGRETTELPIEGVLDVLKQRGVLDTTLIVFAGDNGAALPHGKGSLYEVRRLEKTGWFLHAPCAIHDLKETDGSVTFAVDGWDNKVCYILLAGVEKAPAVTVRPQGTNTADFNAGQKLAAITITGRAEIEVRF